MRDCVVYYQEIPGTVSNKNCTFSYRKTKLLNDGLKRIFDISPDAYVLEKGKHGKPYLASHENAHFNISHTTSRTLEPTMTCFVAGFCSTPLGVDCEYSRVFSDGLIRKITSPEEYAACMSSENLKAYALKLWTLKEAYTKYTGDGMVCPFHTLSFYQDSGGHFQLDGHPEVCFYQWIFPNDLCISVCVETGTKITLQPYF